MSSRAGQILLGASTAPTSQRKRRESLMRDLEQLQAPREPEGPAEDDPAAPLALAVCRAADDRKAREISALHVNHLTAATSFFVSMVGSSKAQINAIVKNIEDEMKEQFGRSCLRQGKAMSGWVCLDYDSIVVNVFSEEQRNYYSIEKYWAAAQVLDLSGVLTPSAPDTAVNAANLDNDDDWGDDDWELEDWNLDDDDDDDEWSLDGGASGVDVSPSASVVADPEVADDAAPVPFDWSVPPEAAQADGDDDEDDEDWSLEGGDEVAGAADNAVDMSGEFVLPDDPLEAQKMLERELSALDAGLDDDDDEDDEGIIQPVEMGDMLGDMGDDDDLFADFDGPAAAAPAEEIEVKIATPEEEAEATAAAEALLAEFEDVDEDDNDAWALGDERLRAIVERAERGARSATADAAPAAAASDADAGAGGWREMMAEDGIDADAAFLDFDAEASEDDDDAALDDLLR